MTLLEINLSEILQEKQNKIIPENIKKDVQIFDITGTYEGSGGGTVEGVKLFETIEEMNSSTGNTEGDLAIVYRNALANMVADTETQYITFPDTVTLPTAFAGNYNSSNVLQAVDSSVSFTPQVTLSQTSLFFERIDYDGWDEYTIVVEYTSTDGITYTRDTTITNPVDLGTVVKPDEEWNDNLGYFMKVDSTFFTGLYKYNGTAWELAPTGLTTVADDVYSTKFYGKNGVTAGTLTTNVSNSFADTNAAVYKKVQQAYDNMTPRVLTDTDKTIDKNIYFIPTKTDGTILLDTNKVTDISYMFDGCTNLTTIPLLNTSNVTDMTQMFSGCTNLTTIPLLNTNSVTDTGNMFSNCTNLQTIPLLDTSSVTNMISMFYHCTNLQTIPLLNTSSVTNMSYMFSNCTNLQTIPLLDTSSVTNMACLFVSCTNLTTIPLLDTSSVTKMVDMLSGCTSLSDDSLNNILAMCTNATKMTSSNKTLKRIGLTSAQAAKCKTLSNYSAFTAAGWTTGY